MKTNYFVIAILIICSTQACEKIDNEHNEANNVTLSEIDFSKLKSGEYLGYYAGGMYGWRENECKVVIDSIGKGSSIVSKIELIRSVEDRPNSFFEELYNRVIEKQSLQVDVISGATLTSKAHFKAIEDALLKSEQEISE